MKVSLLYRGSTIEDDAQHERDGWRITLPDGSVRRVTATRSTGSVMALQISDTSGQRAYRVPVARTDRGIEVAENGAAYVFRQAGSGPSSRHHAASGTLVAPMVGIVAAVHVSEGDAVSHYQPLVVVEAMKVMAAVDAPFDGIVSRIFVKPGDRVAHGAPLIEVARSASDEPEAKPE